jgi:hypothetical protein
MILTATETAGVFGLSAQECQDKIYDAIDRASDQDRSTWLTDEHGKPVAAVVPVEVLEQYEAGLSAVLTGRHHQVHRSQP